MITKERAKLVEREAKRLAGVTTPGQHRVNDGPGMRGLYLQVTGPEARSWVYRYMLNGKPRWMGLGSAFLMPLSQAVVKADAAEFFMRKE